MKHYFVWPLGFDPWQAQLEQDRKEDGPMTKLDQEKVKMTVSDWTELPKGQWHQEIDA